MAGNTIGQLFRVTTFGESHGIALGCIVDGVPPNLELSEADIQPDLDRRKPGTSRYTTHVVKTMKYRFYLGYLKVKQRVPALE